jgi:hypothetical protein
MSASDLRRLERLKANYGDGVATAKLAALRRLSRSSLRTAGQVERLHEALCFLRAYPDDADVLAQATRMLERFGRRADLLNHRDGLTDSGIAGTDIRYRFFWSTALWLVRRWPGRLELERDDDEAIELLGKALPLLAPAVASQCPGDEPRPAFEMIDRLRGKRTDADWLVEQLARLPGDGFTREHFADSIDLPYRLRSGRDTPSRSRAHFPHASQAFQAAALRRGRPDLRAAMNTPPRGVRQLTPREGTALIELARGSMITRARDLAAFEYGEARDVRLADDGDGLAFAFCGVLAERRSLLPALYGYLTLKNGVPIGYGQVDVIGPYAAVSFNTFEAFRGGETAFVFARLLSSIRHLFGAEAFSVDPYQLGQGNQEGLDTGAWWFYQKLGFRPRSAHTRRVMRVELARMRINPRHRSSERTLRKLADSHLFFDFDASAARGLAPVNAACGRAVAWLGRRGGGADALDAASRAALALTGLRSLAGFSRDERLAWRRWAPLVASLPGASRWPPAQRRELAEIVRAKGGGQELPFLLRFAAHPRLAKAVFRG